MNVSMLNSQREKIAIEERKLNGEKVHCLVIYDDPWPNGTGKPAPMLLDELTRTWLIKNLNELAGEETK